MLCGDAALKSICSMKAGPPTTVGSVSANPGVAGSNPCPTTYFVEIDLSTVILPLPLAQKGIYQFLAIVCALGTG